MTESRLIMRAAGVPDTPRSLAPEQIECRVSLRQLTTADLSQAAQIHMAAFPAATLSELGPKQIANFYRWHLTQPHGAAGFALEESGKLLGFCLLVHRNDLIGYLRVHVLSLARAVFSHPRVLLSPLLRKRASQVARALINQPSSWTGQAGTIRLLAIAVHPSRQRMGAGTRLLAEAERLAQRIGICRMALSVHANNAAATQFYERNGFQPVLDATGNWTGQMEKQLTSASRKHEHYR